MKLVNRADGVRGHYCIGRRIGKTIYWEFWTDHNGGHWAGFGQVYVGKEAAQAKLNELRQRARRKVK